MAIVVTGDANYLTGAYVHMQRALVGQAAVGTDLADGPL